MIIKRINQWEFNSINLVLGLLIFLSVFYVGYRLDNNKKNNYQVNPQTITETQLPINLPKGYDNTASLNKDLSIINRSIKQQVIDQSLVNQGFSNKNKTITSGSGNSSISITIASNELKRRLNLVKLVDSEIASTRELSVNQTSLLVSYIGPIKNSLNVLDQKLNLKDVGVVIDKLNSQDKIFEERLIQTELIKVSDDQQVSELLLKQLSNILVKSIAMAKVQGVAVTDLQADLTTVNGDLYSSTAISKPMETYLATSTQPILIKQLTIDNARIETASRDILAAVNAANMIIKALISS